MMIKVTWEDIDNGLKMNSQLCPVALAVRRVFPEARNVSAGIIIRVDEQSFTAFGRKGPYRSASEFYQYFDSFEPVKPCEFELIEYLKNIP